MGLDYVKNTIVRIAAGRYHSYRAPRVVPAWWTLHFSFTPNPAKELSPRQHRHFLHGRQQEITSFLSPKYAGEPVGTLLDSGSQGKSGSHWIELGEVPQDVEFHNGDGLAFFASNRTLTGLRVNRVQRGIVPKDSASIWPSRWPGLS